MPGQGRQFSAVEDAAPEYRVILVFYPGYTEAWGGHRVLVIESGSSLARQAQDLVKRIRGVKTIDNRLISGHQMGWD